MEVKNVKGTHDIIGRESIAYSTIEAIMISFSEAFSFAEFRTPIIESSDLFQRGVGESSDVVRKEMYTFLDKGNRLLALRPEFTASIVRSFVNNKLYATKDLPLKAYYVGPAFRYERPQHGRYRQFHQFGVESLGVKDLLSDVEVIYLGCIILEALGLDNYVLKINTLGDKVSRDNYRAALKEYFKNKVETMCDDCKVRYEVNPLRILDCKVPEDHEVVLNAPKIEDFLTPEARERFIDIIHTLETMEVPYEIDNTLVRGLDYYSEVVFEFHYTSKKGVDYGAIGAGGHYDNLIEELGGPKLSGVGFSFGLERIYSAMNDDGLFDNGREEIDLYVMPLAGDEIKQNAFYIASDLRTAGYRTEIDLTESKISTMFKKAERSGAAFALIFGEDELKSQSIIVKDMDTKQQQTIKVEDLIQFLDDSYEKCGGGHECHCHDHEGK